MFPIDLGYLIVKEKHEDWLRAIAHEQLIKTARLQQSGNRGLRHKVAHWLGIQMVKWGSKLQHYETESPWATAESSPESYTS